MQACGDTAAWGQSEAEVLSRGQVLRGLHGPGWNFGFPSVFCLGQVRVTADGLWAQGRLASEAWLGDTRGQMGEEASGSRGCGAN